MKPTIKHYNCLGCPTCSNPLHDPLFVLEKNQEVKTVKCDNCDFIGYRKGWYLMNKIEENEYKQHRLAKANTAKQSKVDDIKLTTPAYA